MRSGVEFIHPPDQIVHWKELKSIAALRGPNALQLCVALVLKRAGLASVFVAANLKLPRVAIIEGFITLHLEQRIVLQPFSTV